MILKSWEDANAKVVELIRELDTEETRCFAKCYPVVNKGRQLEAYWRVVVTRHSDGKILTRKVPAPDLLPETPSNQHPFSSQQEAQH